MSSKITIREYLNDKLERISYLNKDEIVNVYNLDRLIMDRKITLLNNLPGIKGYISETLFKINGLSDSSKNIFLGDLTSGLIQGTLERMISYINLSGLGYRTLIQLKSGEIVTMVSINSINTAMEKCKKDARINVYYTIKDNEVKILREEIECIDSDTQ